VDHAKANEIPKFTNGDDKNWYRSPVTATNWNLSFPYQLRILKKVDSEYQLAEPKGAVFTLPIPPTGISVHTPFAISGQVTQGGYIEEHNGAPIKMISLTGTTGVTFGRDSGTQTKTISFANAIFAGTVSAV
jgi:hypothetical protein